MPIAPNLIERTLFLTLNQGPGPTLDIWGALAFRIVLAAIRLDAFEALAGGPLTVAELARRIGADERGVAVLLAALEPLGYVERQGGRYRNTAMTARWLLRDSPANFAPYFRYWGTVIPELWANVEETIRRGRSTLNLYEWIEQQPETSKDFQEAMIGLAHFARDQVIARLKLPASARRVLDVGGGHAMYSIELCRKYPGLSATVFDSPQALKTGRENIAAAGMSDRVTVQEGNFYRDELGSGYDVALLFNIVHGDSLEQNVALFRKVARALKPGGQLVVLEQLAGKAPLPLANVVNAILGLSYFHLLQGRIYAFDEIARWFAEAGFRDVRRISLLRGLGSSLIIGTTGV